MLGVGVCKGDRFLMTTRGQGAHPFLCSTGRMGHRTAGHWGIRDSKATFPEVLLSWRLRETHQQDRKKSWLAK